MRNVLVALFFITIVSGNISLSIPPPINNLSWLESFLRINNNYIKPNFIYLHERIGLHNRWNMFTHSPTDTTHGWYNMYYRTEIENSNGDREIYFTPPKSEMSYFKKYLLYRTFKFRDSFWILKEKYKNSFINYHSKKFLLKYPNSTFPLKVKIVGEYEKIPSPGDQNITSTKYDSPFLDTYVSKNQIFCGKGNQR